MDALCKGLYIAELDRPWTETPFTFQGFELTQEEDFAILRSHCRHVYVDPQRSSREALEATEATEARAHEVPAEREPAAPKSRPPPPTTDWSAAHASSGHTFGHARRPGTDRFRRRIEELQARRSEARRVVEQAMEDVRLGRMVDTRQAREFVGDMVETIARDARAALWLTNLKHTSEYTSLHSVHVCILSLAFGMHLAMDREQLGRLGLGTLLHDVGKIRIPSRILHKPGPLTTTEFEIVKRHPQQGYEIVSASGGVSPEALQVIRLHHERCTGTGYPLGLTADRIPRHVLVAAIADTYDAMTSDRPYRVGMDPDKTLQIMYNELAADFGDELVQEFVRCMGIFPEGSLVQLDNGAIGLVMSSQAHARLQPVVLLVQTPDGEPYADRRLLNLAASAEQEESGAPRRISRAVAPAACGVDIRQLLADEFGLAELA